MKFVTILYLFATINLFGQQVRIPDLSGAYIEPVYPMFNSASITEVSTHGNVFFGHKQGVSSFSIFRQNYFNINLVLGSDSTNKQGVGIKVINDNAGKYIASNRISVLYNNSLAISKKTRLSIGIAPTFISYKKEAQSFGGHDNAGSLDVGLWLKSEKLDFGFAANQLIPSTLRVLDEIDSIRSQYILNFKYKYKAGPLMEYRFSSFYSINTSFVNFPVIGMSLVYQKKFKAAFNYEFNRNAVLVLGIEQLKVSDNSGSLEFDVVVSTPTRSNVFRPKNGLEWLISYNF